MMAARPLPLTHDAPQLLQPRRDPPRTIQTVHTRATLGLLLRMYLHLRPASAAYTRTYAVCCMHAARRGALPAPGSPTAACSPTAVIRTPPMLSIMQRIRLPLIHEGLTTLEATTATGVDAWLEHRQAPTRLSQGMRLSGSTKAPCVGTCVGSECNVGQPAA
jgi:hypothetical protein